MVDVGEALRPRKRLRLDGTFEGETYLTTFNKCSGCNSTGGVYTDAAPGQEASQPASAAISNLARTENVYSQTWSYGTTHTTASETCITHSTTTVQSTVARYVRPTLTQDGPQIDTIATSGYDLGFSEVSPRAEICFGALENIPLHQLQSKYLDGEVTYPPVFLRTSQECVQLESTMGSVIGRLDARYSKILRILKDEQSLVLQLFLVTASSQARRRRRARMQDQTPAKAQPKDCSTTLSVNIYGFMVVFETLGEFLSACSENLQSPLNCNWDLPYRNPQSLSGRDDNPPTTFQLESQRLSSHIEELEFCADPSASLESQHSLPETEAPAPIRTKLYSIQKQALSFMLMRELCWGKVGNHVELGEAMKKDFSTIAKYAEEASEEAESVKWKLTAPSQWSRISEHAIEYREDVRAGMGILADSMGLGKTLSMISFLATDWLYCVKTSSRRSPTLLVVPSSLLKTWERELETHLHPHTLSWCRYHGPKRFHDTSRMFLHDIVITTYDVVSADWRRLADSLGPLFSTTWRRVVLDEAHEIRVGSTLRAKAVCALRSHLRWALSGTPISNKWEDLASLLNFLKVLPDENSKSISAMLKSDAPNSLMRSLLGSICLRRSKKALDLPARRDRIHKVEFDRKESEHYKAINECVTGFVVQETACNNPGIYSNVLARINWLRQICNLGTCYRQRSYGIESEALHPQEVFDSMLSAGMAICTVCGKDLSVADDSDEGLNGASEDPESSQPRLLTCGKVICASCFNLSRTSVLSNSGPCQHQPRCASSSVSLSNSLTTTTIAPCPSLPVKMKALQKDLQKIPETDKSIIFSFWTTTLDMVGTALDQLHLPFARMDGTTSSKKRQQALDSFIEDPRIRVILISIGCGANGLNLTIANHVFLMEPQWNPMLEDQALDRVYRIGQTKEVTTTRYIIANTLEEGIRHQQLKKRNLAEQAFALSRGHDNWLENVKAMLSNVP